MKWTFVLMALIGFLSAATAQTQTIGEGYGTNQLAFLNGPNAPVFDTNVQNYWGSYIANAENISPVVTSPVTTMNIWMNNFPLSFSTPITIKGTSFEGNATGMKGVNSQEGQSFFLRNGVISHFNIDQSWRYSPVSPPLSMLSQGNNTPPSKDAAGQVISQSITGLFGV
jgi:hypothetical protein